MHRRKFCHHLAIGSACASIPSICKLAFARTPAKSSHKWVVLYWMPYDNNLSHLGESIVKRLTLGSKKSKAVAIVQSDYLGDLKMRRRQILNGKIDEIAIEGEDSSDVAALSNYLDWANRTFEAEHWVVIICGHGGRLDEISPDDHNYTRQRTWMSVRSFTETVTNFNLATGGRVELLFFQNCHKATLEVVYQARNCARYTLASQLLLGAPNYYYQGFLTALDRLSDGKAAALAIIESERLDMYHTLTVVDNHEIAQIPARIAPLIRSIHTNFSLPFVELSTLPTYTYSADRYCDLVVLLRHLAKSNRQIHDRFVEFVDFLTSSAIVHHQTGGTLYKTRHFDNAVLSGLSGLSLCLPETREEFNLKPKIKMEQGLDPQKRVVIDTKKLHILQSLYDHGRIVVTPLS
jgi:Clostripain family